LRWDLVRRLEFFKVIMSFAVAEVSLD